MMNEKIFNFLGLAMRAGKVKTGESVIVNDMQKGNIKLVILANDASPNTMKLIQNKTSSYKVPFRVFGTREELGIAIGKGERVNVGLTDQGFAKKLLSMIDEYREE
ncbi:hypothetical protein BUZ62_00450 [Staphylococcus pasteuri]|nr:ribosomal L7Ae/L30e/S12e/Gadd45 family protein [Staphylococcus pasteuri]PTU88249.1 hypothetical protein BUZ62_00450 [Staphylococcus pasteuri]